MTQYIDTNVILRYIIRDDSVKASAVNDLFIAARAGKVTLVMTEIVLADVIYVLSSPNLYGLSRDAAVARVLPIVDITVPKGSDRQRFHQALRLYARNSIDFEDALIIVHMEESNTSELFSYDRGFDKFSQVIRIEP